mgnify:CR=1 FL=1
MTNVLLRYANLVLVTLFILSLLSFLLAYLFPGQALENLTGLRFNELTELQNIGITWVNYLPVTGG